MKVYRKAERADLLGVSSHALRGMIVYKIEFFEPEIYNSGEDRCITWLEVFKETRSALT